MCHDASLPCRLLQALLIVLRQSSASWVVTVQHLRQHEKLVKKRDLNELSQVSVSPQRATREAAVGLLPDPTTAPAHPDGIAPPLCR
ncbi:hypothetical protein VFPFJ_06979 [Purpureocillium lilacinum]|uniref:Secreted protein n=1 Tax=Purpureocillium lilacinum TaxID=33203 RepID=A0A179HER2_PURLI|nr:hypothetical protein VFPFJ_06979 [Purpureocillium lilacinum]OAQ88514.1 hypothetical protein VFPFJ_06979 [Purpureocillium lilacinum]